MTPPLPVCIVHSPWDRPTGNGHHVIDPYKGVVLARDIVVLASHTFPKVGSKDAPKQEGWVKVTDGKREAWARITALIDIGADITVCKVTLLPRWVQPVKIPRFLPGSVYVVRNRRDPEWWKLDLKGGHDADAARVWFWPDTERDEQRPGDSGLPAFKLDGRGRWKVVGHNKAGNTEVGYLASYVDRKKEIRRAMRRLRRNHSKR